jgi:hypothetical protein
VASGEKTAQAYVGLVSLGISVLAELLGLLGTSGFGSGGGSGPLDDGLTLSMQNHDNSQVEAAPSFSFVATDPVQPTCMLAANNGALSAVVSVQVDEVAGNITVDCGADGFIFLQSGPEKVPNLVMLDPEGITVSSEELITLSAIENNVIVDPEEGITLQAAENLLTVTEEGIVLTAGPNTITLTPEAIVLEAAGATIELSAEGIVINGMTLELTGDSELSLSAPMISAE